MYIRRTTRRNQDGSTVEYLQLAHNVRDPRTGRPKPQILYNFGRADQLDMEALRRLVQSISRFLSPEDALQAQAAMGSSAPIRFEFSRSMGGAWLLDRLWQKLGIRRVIDKHLAERRFEAPVERCVFAMVANRALHPSSKRAIEEWVRDDVVIPDLPEVPVHQLYRAMDLLLEAEEQIQYDVFFSVAHLFNLEVDLLYFGALCQGAEDPSGLAA